MIKISVVTGTRAEYGLLKPLIRLIHQSPDFELQLIITGMHLSQEFGYTINEILNDGYPITKKVEILLSSDTGVGISKSIGLGIISFSEIFDHLKPDLIVILGDRFEIFSVACAAMAGCFPIAHIHGGELTEGCIDEAIRHSISKMSHYHFVSCEEYRRRVIQLGEQPSKVFNVGSLGIENIQKTNFIEKNDLEHELDFYFNERNLLITFHPATLEAEQSEIQMKNLLSALNKLKNTNLIFTYPNADSNGRIIIQLIRKFCEENKNAKAFVSLGQLKYFSTIRYVDGVVGNSSSGLIEVPLFGKGTINIGNRQKGRLKSSSVIDCEPKTDDILLAINYLYSQEFENKLKNSISPYGKGNTSQKIFELIKSFEFKDILKKNFYDINL